jgi:hypothetical protein
VHHRAGVIGLTGSGLSAVKLEQASEGYVARMSRAAEPMRVDATTMCSNPSRRRLAHFSACDADGDLSAVAGVSLRLVRCTSARLPPAWA